MTVLTLADARTIVDATLGVARERGYAPLTVAVIDPTGEVVLLERSDGSIPLTSRIAVGKARTANVTRMKSGDAGQLPEELVAAARVAYHGDFVTRAGGVPIVRDGDVIGALGVSGAASEEDEAAAEEGIRTWAGE